MNKNSIVSIARTVELSEICTDGSFKHDHVIDIRRCNQGRARPVEEEVLKRLRNHFISYDQMAMDMKDVGPCEEVHLCEMLKEYEGDVLLVTDDVPQVASLCNIYDIPFESKVFYVVETGKGDIIKPFEQPQQQAQPHAARFGVFG